MTFRRGRVLLLCTGNSVRSQMAEALITHTLGDRWEARSAGTVPAGYVHPLALQVLAEDGIQTNGLRSKSVDQVVHEHFDVVITLCDAASETCPVWLRSRAHHFGFPDPARASDSAEGRLEAFRRVRDGIRESVLEYLRAIEPTLESDGKAEDRSYGRPPS